MKKSCTNALGRIFLPGAIAALLLSVAVHADSIFIVDGLAVDTLDRDEIEDEDVFRGALPKFPLVERTRRPGIFLRPGPPARQQASLMQAHVTSERLQAAEVYIQSGQWNQARREIEEALEQDPYNLFLLRRAAAISAVAGKYGAADIYFRRCVKADPENVPFLAGHAGVLIRLFRFDEAEDLIDRALELEPSYLAARFNKACLRILKQETEGLDEGWETLTLQEVEQVASWLEADKQALMPVMMKDGFSLLCDTVLGLGTYGHEQEVRDRLRGAMDFLRRKKWEYAAASLAWLKGMGLRSHAPEMHLAMCLFEMGQVDQSIEKFAELRERYPSDVPIWYNSGYVFLKTSQYTKAAELFRKARELAPGYGEIAFALAAAHAGRGALDDAWPILADLAVHEPAKLKGWLYGDEPYLEAIRNDARYPQLLSRAIGRSASPLP